MAARGGSELERGEIEVAGVRRSYWLARAPRLPGQAAPPLIIALHGSGTDGRGMAWFTGLAKRGAAAGVTTVFPNGWREAWHPARPPDGQPHLDDARFLLELTTHLEGLGAASSWPILLTGLSQGARYAEHVARHGLLPVAGLFLVAGTGLEFSRRQSPVPQLRASMTLVLGTGDRTTPYEGGRLIRRGLTGLRQKRRAAKHGELQDEDIVLGAEALMVDWAAANGITTGPVTEELDTPPGDLPVTRRSWTKPGAHPVTLYRIDGGGHGWPGGPQFLPAGAIGPITKNLDATALVLEMAERESAISRPALGPAAPTAPGAPDAAGAPEAVGAPPWAPAPPPELPALGADRAVFGVVVGEGEHGRVGLKRFRRGGAAVGTDALDVIRAGQRGAVEPALLEPGTNRRDQVRRPAGPGPDHGAALGTELRAVTDCPLDVRVGHVAEQPAGEHQVSRDEVGVLAGQRSIAGDDFNVGQARLGGEAGSHLGIARVELDQAGRHVLGPGVARQHADQVAALAGA